MLDCLDVNQAWKSFRSAFTGVLDSVAPLKEIRIKQNSEPWMTQEILENIRERDSWLRKFKKDKTILDYYSNYSRLRNKVQRDIKKAKREYMKSKIDENKNDSKRLWETLKSLGYDNKSKSSANTVLDVDGIKIHDSKEVADHFNKFFTEVAEKLVGKLPEPSGAFDVDSDNFKSFYSHIPPDSFKLHEISEDFVFKELSTLNVNKSTGLDGLPARFLRDAAEVIKGPITHIVNISIRTEIFPSDMKIAKVKPLYKKKSRLELGNYRPVSILPITSKILEKAVFIQLNEYLVKNNLIYKFQSGFRGKYSTDTCLIYLLDYIRNQIGSGLYTGMVLLDIQKAFDSVHHSILCRKLKAMGVKSTGWFNSYLSNREQIVNVGGTDSEVCDLTCGVPQGSILGPLLFLCYVNDMPSSVNCMLLQYADDSALVVSDKSPDFIGQLLSSNLDKCNKWLVDNKLSLHMGKTELILFGSKNKLRKIENYSITCYGQTIQATPTVKYLGLEIDQFLNGEQVALDIIKKVNARLKFLYRQANYFDTKTKKTLCSALCLCLFDYSISSWYGAISKHLCKKLQIAQNKVIRFILNADSRYHITKDDFVNLGILNIQQRAKQLRLNHVFNIVNGCAPDYMGANFTKVSDVHNYNTRGSAHNFYVPKGNSITSGSFYHNSIHDWSSLPNSIKEINQKDAFKKAVKEYCFSLM